MKQIELTVSDVPCAKCKLRFVIKATGECATCLRDRDAFPEVDPAVKITYSYLPRGEDYPVGRSVARAFMVKYYWPEDTCLYDHKSLRRTDNGQCLTCIAAGVYRKKGALTARKQSTALARISRERALVTHRSKYSAPTPCRACGTDVRYTKTKACVACARRRATEQYVEAKVDREGLRAKKQWWPD